MFIMLCIYRNFCPKREKVNRSARKIGLWQTLWFWLFTRHYLCNKGRWGAHDLWHTFGGKNAYRLLVGKPEINCLFQRLECKWDLNIEMNLREIECEGLGWINLTQNRDRLWALVNVWLAEVVLPSQEGIWPMEFVICFITPAE